MIWAFLKYGHMFKEVNKIDITLTQKLRILEVGDYRPISLSNVIYKLVS